MKTPKRTRKYVAQERSPKQEKELAKKLGGRVPRGSGSGNEKGDVRVKGIARIEAKTTEKKSFSVTQKMLDKIEDAALPNGEVPAFVVEFIDSKGNPKRSVAVVPMWVLESLTSK